MNPAHRLFGTLDLAFIVEIVLSISAFMLTFDAVCGEKEAGTLRLQAAFCFNREVVSEAFLEMPRPATPTDTAFRGAMAQLMNELLPSQSPNRSDCGDVASC